MIDLLYCIQQYILSIYLYQVLCCFFFFPLQFALCYKIVNLLISMFIYGTSTQSKLGLLLHELLYQNMKVISMWQC